MVLQQQIKIPSEKRNCTLKLTCIECVFPMAVPDMATGTRIKPLESTAQALASWSSSSGARPLARCAVLMRSHRPMANGRPSLVSLQRILLKIAVNSRVIKQPPFNALD